MPLGHGVAFVLIQHHELSRGDLRLEQLQKNTALTVVEATDGIPVLTDRIHVMPLDKFLNITGGALTLQEPVYCNGLRMPIDHFCSLAADLRHRACGVVLSGTGSDGALGLSEIKASGGRTIVEDPGNAEHLNLPKSAIEAGVVDAVLPVGAMIEAIVTFAREVTAAARNEPKNRRV
jgi:two-component system CheB/CheR fusion protein